MTVRSLALVAWVLAGAHAADAQPLGTFRWQLQPYCNVVTATVSQSRGVYTLDGYDDQCGAPTRALLTGTAALNPNGTIDMGLTIVSSPSGLAVHVAASLDVATLGGSWVDSEGQSGAIVVATGTAAAGQPRPVPSIRPIPTAIAFSDDGSLVSIGAGTAGSIPASGPGTRMMWYSHKASFRAGKVSNDSWDDARIGTFSTALGHNTVASGVASTAIGSSATASGPYSAAFGSETTASGFASAAFGIASTASGMYSVAMGDGSTASGPQSTAMGMGSTAAGQQSFAAGREVSALGHQSIAMGRDSVANGLSSAAIGSSVRTDASFSVALGTLAATAPGATGSFVYGDSGGDTALTATQPNQFLARVTGGVRFYSNLALTAGVMLEPGGSAWSSVSDVNLKENFRELDGAGLLAKIAAMPIREWNYTSQDPAIRHVGPTAQDFYAAFGLGEDPLRISTIDADGIALAAIKALALENQVLQAELARLLARMERLDRTRVER